MKGDISPSSPEHEISKAGLIRRIAASLGDNINTDPEAGWNTVNDQFHEAIKLSVYQPQTAIDTINELLLDEININARNDEGRTLLSIARFYLAPRAVLDIIEKASGEYKEVGRKLTRKERFRRAATSDNELITRDSDSEWNRANDRFREAILLSNYQPQDAIEKIIALLLDGVNINAKNKDGRTLLSIARFHEVPNAIQQIIIEAGGK